MTFPEIRAVVVTALCDNQEIGGKAVPDSAELTDEFRPMEHLEGFDSLNALEVCMELSERLGCEIHEGSIFRPHADGEHVTIRTIVQRLARILSHPEDSPHE
jgi:acyl carrier protein